MITLAPEVSLDAIIARDGSRCAWCGAEVWRRDLTFEHVLPRSSGGLTSDENAVVACKRCNRERGSRPVVAFVRARLAAGAEPQVPLIRGALERLSESPRRRHREYGARQLGLLRRI